MRLRNIWVSALGLTLAASVVACGGGSNQSIAEPSLPHRGRGRRAEGRRAPRLATSTAS